MIRFCGDDALQFAETDLSARISRAHALRASGAWSEVVEGRQTICVQFNPVQLTPEDAVALLSEQLAVPASRRSISKAVIELPAAFGGSDGPDLEAVAVANEITPEELIARVSASVLEVELLGFTPGFAYLGGLDPTIHMDRLETPRTRVRSGSIGIISGQIGLYALAGPGGWPIIGRVIAPLFDKSSVKAARLEAGDRVQLSTR